jgi:F-type H+-transporting ATPase subunit b
MELLKLLSAPELIAQIISFLILFFILRAFAWKKFLNILDQRKERIAAEFNKIESAKAQLEKLKQEYEGKLASKRKRVKKSRRQKPAPTSFPGR